MILTDPSKKKMSTIIMAKLGKPDAVESTEPPVSDSDMALESAMEDFIEAVEAKNASRMAACLKDFIYLCGEHGEGE